MTTYPLQPSPYDMIVPVLAKKASLPRNKNITFLTSDEKNKSLIRLHGQYLPFSYC
jgi:hypothetical protein